MSPDEDDRTPTMETSSESHAQRIPHLVSLTGPSVGIAYRLTNPEMVVGREGDIRLVHPGVSRRHARLLVTADQVVVDDLGSTNGTFVGVDRVKAPTVLNEGDAVAFGAETMFRLTYTAVADAVPTQAKEDRAATHVGSREFLLALLQAEYAYARRHRSPLTLVFFRSDVGASVGGSLTGEVMAEESLSRLAIAIDVTIRTEDVVARSADDEFVVLVRGDASAATHMAERVRARVDADSDFPERAMTWQTVTAVVLPVLPAPLGSPPQRPPRAEEILAGARMVARPAMNEASNGIVRLRPVVV
jgi:diguanylate cyclase (GGDEF)-like protein